jgi:hypothetical protein
VVVNAFTLVVGATPRRSHPRTQTPRRSASLLVSVCFFATVGTASADVFTFNTSDSPFDVGVRNQGWWSETLAATDSSANYAVGRNGTGDILRNFFTFDLAALSGFTVSAATLEVRRFIASGDPTLSYKLSDVSTDAATLNNNTGVSASIFADLGTGTSYGTFLVPTTTGASTDVLTFVLNAAAIADINAAVGGFFSLGGSLDPLGAGTQQLFAFSGGTGVQRLVITATAVSEPATLVLMGSALAALAAHRSRKKK